MIIHNNPYLLFVKISHLINSNKVFDYGVHESVVSKTSNLKKKISINPNAVIGKNVLIDEKTVIGANCYIGDEVHIGKNVFLHPNVTIYDNVKIGNNVIIHSGTVIGSDGLGILMNPQNGLKSLKIGGVKLGTMLKLAPTPQ